MGFSIALVVMLVVPSIPHLLGVSPDEQATAWQALASICVAIPVVVGALYAAGLLWLFLVCQVFTREEIEQFIKAGPNTRLEIWVLDRFSR